MEQNRYFKDIFIFFLTDLIFLGTGDVIGCVAIINEILNSTSCNYGNCGMNGIFQPEITVSFTKNELEVLLILLLTFRKINLLLLVILLMLNFFMDVKGNVFYLIFMMKLKIFVKLILVIV